jgi:uncharacterized delta-60 repeat protein
MDPAFGNAGVLSLPAELPSTAGGVATQGGELLVSSGSGVQVLNDAGAAGGAFGGMGSLTVPAAPGGEFLITDLTIDRQGRLLVLGETRFPESENPSPPLGNGLRVFRPGVVRLLRFLPDGQLDPSFGQGGVVETDLGLPPPRGTHGQRLGPHPVVEPGDVAVDRQGRIIVTGGALVRLENGCRGRDRTAPVPVSAGFVARLTESGAPDPGFGTGGLVGGRGLSGSPLGAAALGDPVVGATGAITVRATSAYSCGTKASHLGITRLTPAGRTDQAFGDKGSISGPYAAMVGGPRGSVVALAVAHRRHPEKEALEGRVVRFTAEGKRDRSFGRDGGAAVKLGTGNADTLDSLAVDSRGRILVGGMIGIGKGRSLALLRVSAGGRWEENFGPHGRVATRVSGLVEYGGNDLFFDPQGRLVAVRIYSQSPKVGGSGLMIARYLLRN